ncbi:TagK domain-containing protein [Paraburkholderia sp. J12]|uniref:TagK domain-containing protein n=1 Tax=Paraburkholderia sp. J12 TaxID=2805432 RepID=UPI002ABE9A0C|nr:TagK domain-containing protein [Paraburkholderia sp. J12]
MTGYQARWDNTPLAPASKASNLLADRSPVQAPDQARAPFANADFHVISDLSFEDRLSSKPVPSDSTAPASPADFSDLIAMSGALADRDGDPLLSLLDRSAPAMEDPDDGKVLFLPVDTDGQDPLATLTLEYQQALLSQKSGHEHDLKSAHADGSGPIIVAPQDPFADLANHPDSEASVFDLLTKGRNIDTLLGSLDAFDAGQIFEAEKHHDILTLLAPRGIAARRGAHAAPLSREEHHMISMDSHMAMPDVIEEDTPGSPHENHR